MRLEELKSALVEQFFKISDNGVHIDQLFDIFVSLGKHLKTDVSELADVKFSDEEKNSRISSDPSKAFRKFADGKTCLLAILEEPGMGTGEMVMFAAVRVGKSVYVIDLTDEKRHEKKGDLALVKQALRQAKNLNDDVYFSITSGE